MRPIDSGYERSPPVSVPVWSFFLGGAGPLLWNTLDLQTLGG